MRSLCHGMGEAPEGRGTMRAGRRRHADLGQQRVGLRIGEEVERFTDLPYG